MAFAQTIHDKQKGHNLDLEQPEIPEKLLQQIK